jgi:hypothetical protein
MSDQMMVHCTEKVDDVLARALDKRGTPMVPGSCQLLVKYSKDESAVVLLGELLVISHVCVLYLAHWGYK